MQPCFVLVAGAGVGDGVGVALVVAVADAEGVGEIAADAADAVEDGATAGPLGVGVVLELGVGDGDDETGTFSVVQFATAAIEPQIAAMRITMTSRDVRYFRRVVAMCG